MTDDRRELVELMALQSLFRWPAMAREIGIGPEHWRTSEEGRRLAGAGLGVVFPRADGSLPLTNTAAAAGVPLGWVREHFTATLLDPAQGRAWLGELADLEEARILREQVEGAFRNCGAGELGDALAGIVRAHQSRTAGKGLAAVTNMEVLSQRFIADRIAVAESGGEVALPIGGHFPRLSRIMRGGWQAESTVILAGPGTGKTTLCEYFRRLVAEQGAHSLLFSAEMPNELLAERYVRAECMNAAGSLGIPEIMAAGNRIAGSPTASRMHVFDQEAVITPEMLWDVTETMKSKLGSLGLVAIDHVARIRRAAQYRMKDWEMIHEAALEIAKFVKHFKIPTLVLAHMTTEAGAQTDTAWEPGKDCIAGGGKLANESGNVFAIWRNPTGTWLKVVKCRMNGPTEGEKFALRYHPETQSYAEES